VSKKSVTIIITIGTIVLLLVGFLSLRSPRPIVELKAETVFQIAGFPIANTVITSWIVIVLLTAFCFFAFRRMELVPRGLQNFAEMAMEAFYNLVVTTAGEKHARRFFPVVGTIFFYVLVANWLGLFPGVATIGKVEEMKAEAEGGETLEKGFVFDKVGGMNVIMPGVPSWPPHEPGSIDLKLAEDATPAEKEAALEEATKDLGKDEKAGLLVPFLRSVNTDINSPLALALMSAIFVEFWGISALGFFRYGSKFVNVRRLLQGKILDGFIDVFVGVLEFFAEVARIVSFTFRLFGNILAGEILFLVILFLLPVIALDLVYGMELFVGLIQAFIFAMLTLVFGVVAVSAHGDEHEAKEGSPAKPS
jgi:F-type H+-transporting ATPase subunit a